MKLPKQTTQKHNTARRTLYVPVYKQEYKLSSMTEHSSVCRDPLMQSACRGSIFTIFTPVKGIWRYGYIYFVMGIKCWEICLYCSGWVGLVFFFIFLFFFFCWWWLWKFNFLLVIFLWECWAGVLWFMILFWDCCAGTECKRNCRGVGSIPFRRNYFHFLALATKISKNWAFLRKRNVLTLGSLNPPYYIRDTAWN